MSNVTALLFDLDGTLCDTDHLHFEAYRILLKDFARTVTLDYYKTLPGRIAKVSQKDVKRVVTKWIKPDRWPVVIVGPIGQSRAALEKLNLGPVTIAPAPGSAPKTSASR